MARTLTVPHTQMECARRPSTPRTCHLPTLAPVVMSVRITDAIY